MLKTAAHAATIAELARGHMDALSPAERRVARTLLSDYPSAGLSTAADLARRASTSAPSVVRFATRLGLDGFSELQGRLRTELTVRRESPARRARSNPGRGTAAELTDQNAAHRADLITESIASVPSSEIDATVRALSDISGAVLLAGGYFSSLIARYFGLQLSQVRPGVYYVGEPMHRDVNYLLGVGKRDVLVAFDLRRYESDTIALAQEAKRRGCTTIVVTDEWLSPASTYADVVLPVPTEASHFDSLVPVLSLVESLMPAVVGAIGPAAVQQMAEWEALSNPRRRKLADDE
ncbi:MAG: MurR/RpiR family transcriptional regulator [Streptosporangiales bacterium]